MRPLTVTVSIALLLAACRGDDKLPPPAAGTPVFIISIDTLRSDRLPAYGYKGVETPRIDAFLQDAVLYERAYAHTPLTLPSHASILSGALPAEHGVRDNTGYRFGTATKVRSAAEVLAERGYATGAAVSSFVLRRQTGIDRGFSFYDDSVAPLNPTNRQIGAIQRDGAETVQVATEWIGKQTRPVFFLLHLYEPHLPYTPPEPYRSRYTNRYDGEIARSDEIVGNFLDSLKQSGLYEKSLIILLSDHGEGLGDHGEEEHGTFLYREAIQVPLLVKFPDSKFRGKSVAAPVQLIDVVPTIFERLGIPGKFEGRSLASFLGDEKGEWRRIYSESYYPRFHYGWSDQHSLIDGRHHYIHSTKAELFDLEKDPGEKTNVLEADRRTYFAMKSAIEPLVKEASAPGPVNPEEAAKLAALGYLGSTVQTKPGEVLPDPKDHIHEVASSSEAFSKFHQRKYAEALAIIDRLLAANPRILDLWDLKAKALMRTGRIPEAVAAAKEGLRLSPNATHIAVDVATMQIELGNLDDAQKHAELALAADPAHAHDLLARVWIGRKDLARAEAEAQKAIESTTDRVAPLITMALVRREQGKYEEALRLLNEARSKKNEREHIASLYFLRGDMLARLGRAEEAEKDFRREIELFPEDAPAYRNLALLLVADGRLEEATELIRKLVAEAPVPASYYTVCQVLEAVGDERGVRYWARQGLARFPGDPALRRLAS